MSSCRCAYVVPASYAKNIKIDTKQDIVLPEDANLWAQFHDLRPRFVHYVGNNPAIFDFVKQTQALCLRWQPQSSGDFVEVGHAASQNQWNFFAF